MSPSIRKLWSPAKTAPFIAWGALTVAASAMLAQPHPQTNSSGLETEFQAAMDAQEQGDLNRAKGILLGLRRSHHGIFAVDESLGLIYVAQQQYTDALPLLQAAIREQPSSDVAHSNLGADFFKLQRNREAMEEFKVAARLNPKNSTTQQGLGELWLDAGKPERAAEAFSLALQGKPNDPDLELDLATALVAARNFDKAQGVLSLVPGWDASADAQYLLGQIEEARGHSVEAARRFDRAVQLEPSEPNVWMLGVELLRHWTFDAAISEYEAATVRFPGSVRMKLGLGAAYFGDEKYGESIPVFAELLDNDKDNVLYAELLGMACNAVTQADKEKCASLVIYADKHPSDARAATYAASMLLDENTDQSRTDQIQKLLNNALSTDPKLPDAHYQLGVLKQNQGDWPGSIPNLETAVKLKPNLAQAHYHLALAYWRTGRKEEGKAEMELQKKYSKQEQEDLNRRLRQITTFIVDARN